MQMVSSGQEQDPLPKARSSFVPPEVKPSAAVRKSRSPVCHFSCIQLECGKGQGEEEETICQLFVRVSNEAEEQSLLCEECAVGRH